MAVRNDSPQRIPFVSLRLHSCAVRTVTDIRHANLLRLIAVAGSVQALATSIGRSHSQVSQLKNKSPHSKSGRPREIGDDMARHIEEARNLPTGWMDQERDHVYVVAPHSAHLAGAAEPVKPYGWPFARISPTQYARLSTEARLRAEGYIERLLDEAGTSGEPGTGTAA